MTLNAYSPDSLDELSLRVLDICVVLRRMAGSLRSDELDELTLNDKKALEWLGRLEEWALKAERELEVNLLKQRGAKAARTATTNANQQPGEKGNV